METGTIRAAILDLYNNEENQEIRCIKEILAHSNRTYNNIPVEFNLFNIRGSAETAAPNYDIYISSGGPGSPWDGLGTKWESGYFSLLDSLWSHNQKNESKKYLFFICHSFQIMARYFGIADVTKRDSESFGVAAIRKTEAGMGDYLFNNLPDPFYGADFRSWQVINPDRKRFDDLGAKILCLENEGPDANPPQALTAVRINDEFAGTQFHPESDVESLRYYFHKPERRERFETKYGAENYLSMLRELEEPAGLSLTRRTILPNFLKHAITKLRPH